LKKDAADDKVDLDGIIGRIGFCRRPPPYGRCLANCLYTGAAAPEGSGTLRLRSDQPERSRRRGRGMRVGRREDAGGVAGRSRSSTPDGRFEARRLDP
jgi:hypothetical protein